MRLAIQFERDAEGEYKSSQEMRVGMRLWIGWHKGGQLVDWICGERGGGGGGRIMGGWTELGESRQ